MNTGDTDSLTRLHLLSHFQVRSDPVIQRGMKDVLKHNFDEGNSKTDITDISSVLAGRIVELKAVA